MKHKTELSWVVGDTRYGSDAVVVEHSGIGYTIIPQRGWAGVVKNFVLYEFADGLDAPPTGYPGVFLTIEGAKKRVANLFQKMLSFRNRTGRLGSKITLIKTPAIYRSRRR